MTTAAPPNRRFREHPRASQFPRVEILLAPGCRGVQFVWPHDTMTSSEAFQKFGFPASPRHRAEIRQLLIEEIEREKQGQSGEEMLRTLCVQLFSLGDVEDALLIWDARRSSFDAGCGLDVQFLCGAGLSATKAFLAASKSPSASAAL